MLMFSRSLRDNVSAHFFLQRASKASDVLARMFCTQVPLVRLGLPSRREVHFWYILPDEVQHESLLKEYQKILSPCEIEEISCIKIKELKKRALLTRTLVRTTISRSKFQTYCMFMIFGIKKDTDSRLSPSLLKFQKNIYGKPEVMWEHGEQWCRSSLCFNISHTSSLIACGVTVDMQIGIDVEEKQRMMSRDVLALAKRFFSPQEVNFLGNIKDSGIQRQEFIKLWTLKESYVKALGWGIFAVPFRKFTIHLKASDERHGSPNFSDAEIVLAAADHTENLTTNWQFSLFEIDASYYAAVCMETATIPEENVADSFTVKVWKTLPLVEDVRISET